MAPWLVFYLLVSACSLFCVPLVIIWFVFVAAVPLAALAALGPLLIAVASFYFWLNVNGYFVSLGLRTKGIARMGETFDRGEIDHASVHL